MFDGVQQDQFHQFLATTTSTATSRPIHTSTIPSSAHPFSLSSNPPFTLHHPHLHPHHHDSIRTTAASTYPVSFVDHHHNPFPLPNSHHHHLHQVLLQPAAPHFLHQQTPLPLQLQVHHHQVHRIINNGEIKAAAAGATYDGLTGNSQGDDINGGLLSVAGGNIMIMQERPAVSLLQRQEEVMDNPCHWSNKEVLTLLRIRSSMENWFPNLTWEHVSRKLADHGFKRSAENCKQKFEEESRYFNISNGSRSAPTAPATANSIPAASIISNKNNNYSRLFCNDIDEAEDLYNTHQHQHQHQHQHHDNAVVHHHFDQQQTQNSHQSPTDHSHHDHHQNNDRQHDTLQSVHDANDCNGHQISAGNDEEGQKDDEAHEEVVQVATVDIDEKEEGKMRQQRSVEEAPEAADSTMVAIVAAETDKVVVDDQEDHHPQSVDGDNNNNNQVCSSGHNHDDRHNNDNEMMIERKKRSSTTSSSSRSNKRKRQNHNHGHYGHHQSSKKKFEMFKGFCVKIMYQMMSQQEELHNKILEDMVKRDAEKITREEAWKKQEIDRINKEMEGRAHEQATAGDRQARIMEFLKQFTSGLQENNNTSIKVPNISNAAPATIDIASTSLLLDKIASTAQTSLPILTDSSSLMIQTSLKSPSSMISTDQYTSSNMSTPADHHKKSTLPMSLSSNVNRPNSPNTDANSVIPTEGDIVHPPISPAITSKIPRVKSQQSIVRCNTNSSSTDHYDTGNRWPRDEVLTLINIRCSLYNNNSGGTAGTHANVENNNSSSNKAPLWERISQKMLEVGYKRSAKRCKEKWENINKYFRKTKDSNKKRPVDSRTCPYFHQLSHLYSQGAIGGSLDNHVSSTNSSVSNNSGLPELAASTEHGGGNGAGIDDHHDHIVLSNQ